ncbi:MAG TPA: chitosanase [Oscillatoriaceae cyanobacterium]
MPIGAFDAGKPVPSISKPLAAPTAVATKPLTKPATDDLNVSAAYQAARQAPGGMTPDQKLRAEHLTSLFENSTIDLQYAYTEALKDGRGITAGRAGFTSGTGDMLEVIQKYTAQVPNNPLARYLPRLNAINAAKHGKGSLVGLEGLQAAWHQAANDPKFRAAQDAVVDEQYYQPAMQTADQQGLKTPLARAVMYDTIIQHGGGDDPDGLPALVAATDKAMGGSPAQGVNEHAWVEKFLSVRHADLAHAHDPSTRKAWAESVDRVNALGAIAQSGNWNLQGPMNVSVYGSRYTVP